MITQAMILAAGEGRRLRPLTQHTPKPLVQVGGKAMLDHVLDHMAVAGVNKCVINTHHLAEQIHDHVKKRTSPEIIISHETELLETGGGILKALPYFEGKSFFVVNADIWWRDAHESCLRQLDRLWDSEKMDALLVLVPRENALGHLERGDYFLEEDGKAQHRGDRPIAPYIFSGIRILHPRLLKGQSIHPFSILTLFHKAQSQSRLYGLVHEGQWGDMGTIENLKITNDACLSSKITSQRSSSGRKESS